MDMLEREKWVTEGRVKIKSKIREIFCLLLTGFKSIILDDFTGNVSQFRGLSLQQKIVAGTGVLLVVLISLMAIFFIRFPHFFYRVSFAGLSDEMLDVPMVAPIIAMLFSAIGWAFLLTGAVYCKKRVFFPVLAMFSLQYFLMVNAMSESLLMILYFLFLLLIVGLLLVSYFLLSHLRQKNDFSLLEFFVYSMLLIILTFLNFTDIAGPAELADAFSTSLALFVLVAMLFWFRLGIDVVEFVGNVARWTVEASRTIFSSRTAKILIFLFLLLKIPLDLVYSDAFLIDLPVSIIVLVVALVTLIKRRYTTATAHLLLAISVMSPLVSFAAMLALFVEADFYEIALGQTHLFSPVSLFAVLIIWDMVGSGKKFLVRWSRVIPWVGRVFLYLGFIVLGATSTFFYMSADDPWFQDLANDSFALGVVFLGIPYMILFVVRRRKRLVTASSSPDQNRGEE
jgi:hypothetical protein